MGTAIRDLRSQVFMGASISRGGHGGAGGSRPRVDKWTQPVTGRLDRLTVGAGAWFTTGAVVVVTGAGAWLTTGAGLVVTGAGAWLTTGAVVVGLGTVVVGAGAGTVVVGAGTVVVGAGTVVVVTGAVVGAMAETRMVSFGSPAAGALSTPRPG